MSAKLAVSAASASWRLGVVAPDRTHLAWAGAARFAETAAARGAAVAPEPALPDAPSPDLVLMPLRSLATRVPALQVLEQPFLFADLAAAHAALDGELGATLREETRAAGFEILAFWDEGLQAMSGNRRFDRVLNLTGVEFLLLREDPVAEQQFRAFDAWTRAARPQTRDELLRECLVASRATTLQQMQREHLARVHLDLSLTGHRYEGWVLVAESVRWQRLPEAAREAMEQAARETLSWQRGEAAAREAAALAELERQGIHVHRLTPARRREFVAALPARESLLPDSLDPALKSRLIRFAARAAVRLPGTEPGTAP